MDLLSLAAGRRDAGLAALDDGARADLGQFLTPIEVALLMAALPRLPRQGVLRVLDPGAGSGVLSAAVVDRVRREAPDLRLEVTAVEVDERLHGVLAQTLGSLEDVGVRTTLVRDDFVNWALGTDERFDLVIQNPPYRKIRSGSTLDRDLRSAGIIVPNIYAGFMALGSLLLDDLGQQVSITPRSWMNGTYFSEFRRTLLTHLRIDCIHTFQSRSQVFGDLGVLQETIIVATTRGAISQEVRLSSSLDHRDTPASRSVPYSQVVTDDFIFVPASDEDGAAVSWMERVRHTLADLGLTVSTGKVVGFRSRDLLTDRSGRHNAPMVYPANLVNAQVVHPRSTVRKPQWLRTAPTHASGLLVPAGSYVLVKRFSTKEERRRIVASLWSDDRAPAFDNKLNYIHQQGHGIDPRTAAGLVVWLNSKHVDDYFRVFSGHTQVNAGDLRRMKFPTLSQLRLLGESTLSPDDAVERIMGDFERCSVLRSSPRGPSSPQRRRRPGQQPPLTHGHKTAHRVRPRQYHRGHPALHD